MKNRLKNKIWYIIPVFLALFNLKSEVVFSAVEGCELVHPPLTIDNYIYHFYFSCIVSFLSVLYFLLRNKLKNRLKRIVLAGLLISFLILVLLFFIKVSSFGYYNCY